MKLTLKHAERPNRIQMLYIRKVNILLFVNYNYLINKVFIQKMSKSLLRIKPNKLYFP